SGDVRHFYGIDQFVEVIEIADDDVQKSVTVQISNLSRNCHLAGQNGFALSIKSTRTIPKDGSLAECSREDEIEITVSIQIGHAVGTSSGKRKGKPIGRRVASGASPKDDRPIFGWISAPVRRADVQISVPV